MVDLYMGPHVFRFLLVGIEQNSSFIAFTVIVKYNSSSRFRTENTV